MLTKHQKKILIITSAILAVSIVITLAKHYLIPLHQTDLLDMMGPIDIQTPTPQATPLPPTLVTIHIAGAVETPGVYKVPKGTTAIESIQLAGGLLPEANLDKVNLAATLKNGKRLYIPYIKPAKSQKSRPASNQSTPTHPINLNLATAKQLKTIPGIGPKTAQRIIDYRTLNGSFSSLSDITKVNGIGSAKLIKIQPFLTL